MWCTSSIQEGGADWLQQSGLNSHTPDGHYRSISKIFIKYGTEKIMAQTVRVQGR